MGPVGRRILVGLFLVGAIPAGTARSGPIQHRQATTQGNPAFTAWNRFLAGGETEWEHHAPPKITAQIHVLMNRALNSADPTANANVQYLMWRRDLDPARFDHWHPRIGPMLQALETSPATTPVTTSPQVLTPPSSSMPGSSAIATNPSPAPSVTSEPSTGPQTTSPAPESIPEPGAFSIALVLIGAGLCWHRWYGRTAARSLAG
jgi:hypothetical protein